jgi:DNA-binding winged helix-turn-helix (wHTH) protein
MPDPADSGPREPFQIGDWSVDPELGRISKGDRQVQLRPRAMDVLVCLAELQGRLATKQHLIDSVWRTEYVSDNALTHVIAELRTELGDDAEQPSYIETIPRRGYRIIAPVTLPESDHPPPPADPPLFKLESDEGEIPLADGDNLIGRAPDAPIRIDNSEVSRRHALIVVEGSTATLEDLGSKNGTFLRGKRLEAPAKLANADEIRIGLDLARFRFVVHDDRTRTEQARRARVQSETED